MGNEVGEQFVLKNGTDFLLVLLIRIDALSVNDVFRVFDEAPCCFCGAAIRDILSFIFEDKISFFLGKEELFATIFHFSLFTFHFYFLPLHFLKQIYAKIET